MELTRDVMVYTHTKSFVVEMDGLESFIEALEYVVLSDFTEGYANLVTNFNDGKTANNYSIQINNTYNETGRLLSLSYSITDEKFNFIKAYNKKIKVPVAKEDYEFILNMMKNLFQKDELPDVNNFEDITNWAIFDVPVEDKWNFIKSSKKIKFAKQIKETIPEWAQYLHFGINPALMTSFLLFRNSTKEGNYKLFKIQDEEDTGYYVDFSIPSKYKQIFNSADKIKITCDENAVSVSLYSQDGSFIESDIEDLVKYKQIISVLFILVIRDFFEDSFFYKIFKEFAADQTFEKFKQVYKYFIKKHKKDNSRYGYWNISAFDPVLDDGQIQEITF